VLHACFAHDNAATLSEHLEGDLATATELAPQLACHGAADILWVVASDLAGSSLALCALLPIRSALTASVRRTWLQVALHWSAGLRLRGARPREADATNALSWGHDAGMPVLDKSARAALRQAARAIDRRPSLSLSDPSAALALHRAAELGHWSLVDHFDADGRRFLLLCRSARGPATRVTLSEREGQATALAARGYSNKRIAYALGLSTGSVSTLLYRAARKWGAGSRTRLTQAWRERHAEIPLALADGDADAQVASAPVTRAIKSDREVTPSLAAARANSTRIVE
jgi:DNA-binding CsgD family transcriptional regulator